MATVLLTGSAHYFLQVTQDVDNSEGTGVWTVEQSAHRHVAAPTM